MHTIVNLFFLESNESFVNTNAIRFFTSGSFLSSYTSDKVIEDKFLILDLSSINFLIELYLTLII